MERILYRGTSQLALEAELRRQELLREACHHRLAAAARKGGGRRRSGIGSKIAALTSWVSR